VNVLKTTKHLGDLFSLLSAYSLSLFERVGVRHQ